MKLLWLTDPEIAFHEAAHWIAANHFGLNASVYIWPNPRYGSIIRGRGLVVSRYRGVVHVSDPTTKFRKAVIAWAGVIVAKHLFHISEDVNDWPDADIPTFEKDNWQFSALDRRHIFAYPQRRRAFKAAWQIVIQRRVELVAMAKSLPAGDTNQ